jgi:peroxiredoxin
MKAERKKVLLKSLVWILLVGFSLAACGDNTTSGSAVVTTVATQSGEITPAAIPAVKDQPPVKVAVGFTAPDFTAKDVNGQTLRLSDYRGKAVLINFWADYCEPCRQELPDLIKFQNANKANFTVIGINWNEDLPQVKQYIKDNNIPFPVTIDDTGDLITLFRAKGQPTNIFIDRSGIIRLILPGGVTQQVLDQQLENSLK